MAKKVVVTLTDKEYDVVDFKAKQQVRTVNEQIRFIILQNLQLTEEIPWKGLPSEVENAVRRES